MSELNTHDLTNEEILYLYYTAKVVTSKFELAFKEKGLKSIVPTPLGMIVYFRPLDEEAIITLKNDPDYVIPKNIIEKLSVIAEFIESTGEDYSYVSNIFKQQQTPFSGDPTKEDEDPESDKEDL